MLKLRAVPARTWYSTHAVKSFSIPNLQPQRKNLIGLTLPELQLELESVPGIKPYTVKQIWSFMYKQGMVDLYYLLKGVMLIE
jgi:hypothetical protein